MRATWALSFSRAIRSRSSRSWPVSRSRISTASRVFVFAITQNLFVRVGVRAFQELLLPCNCPVDVGVGNPIFLGEPMCQDGCQPSVKEVEEPVVDSTELGAKLVDAVAQVVGLGAAKLVSEFCKTLDASNALGVRGLVVPPELLEPVESGHLIRALLVEDDVSARQRLIPRTITKLLSRASSS